jgi:hypothetical protein
VFKIIRSSKTLLSLTVPDKLGIESYRPSKQFYQEPSIAGGGDEYDIGKHQRLP